MDVNMSITNKSLDLSKLKSTSVDALAEIKNVPTISKDRDGDRDNGIGKDNMSLSAEALKLSSTSVTPAVNNQTQISNSQEAMNVVNRLLTDSQSNPNQLRQAYGPVSSANTRRLLA